MEDQEYDVDDSIGWTAILTVFAIVCLVIVWVLP